MTSYGEHPALLRIDPASLRVTARIWLASRVASGCGLWSVAAEGRWVLAIPGRSPLVW